MVELIQKPEEDIFIRTMKSDIEKLTGVPQKKEEKSTVPIITPLPPRPNLPPRPQETAFEKFKTPTISPMPTIPFLTHEMKPPMIPAEEKPPILVITPKIIPPKEVPMVATRPLIKTMPVWIKLGVIGFGTLVIILGGLYGYWKIFVQSPLPPALLPPITTTTVPTLPTTSIATTTALIKFFNKLPHKTITIDLSAKTSLVLLESLKSEAKMEEARASVKQIKITFEGRPLTTAEFFELMSVFAPKDFLNNYESEYILALFSQKEGARPILILKTKNKAETQTQIKKWELGMLPSDISPLFLSNFKLPRILPPFKSYQFIGQPVHYLNVGIPFASLNYAIYNDFLIFTTSSAGMFVVLQDLTGQFE